MHVFLDHCILDCEDHYAVVVGTHINGLNLIRSLAKHNIPVIALDWETTLGQFSRYPKQKIVADYSGHDGALVETLLSIGTQLRHKAVLFFTDDHQLRVCAEYYSTLEPWYHIPLNPSVLLKVLSKEVQYECCLDMGIPCPASFYVKNEMDLESLLRSGAKYRFPLIIKPFDKSRYAGSAAVFRLLEIHEARDLGRIAELIRPHLEVGFIVSEIIPGDPEQIWSFNGYCDEDSNVMAGWTGQKLSQRPYYYGSFTVARSIPNNLVRQQGEAVLKALGHMGPAAVEFKYDARDGQYKYIETNFRYTMRNGLGGQAGVDIAAIHYYHVLGNTRALQNMPSKQSPVNQHQVLALLEWFNIVDHKPRLKHIRSAFRSMFLPNRSWGIFEWSDPVPALYYLMSGIGSFMKTHP